MNLSKLYQNVQYFRAADSLLKRRMSHHICNSCWRLCTVSSRGLSTSPIVRDKSKSDTPTEFKIYDGPLTGQIRNVKIFSLITSTAGVLSQPLIFERASELGTSTSALVAVCSVVGFFTFVTPFLLHLITRKYVTSVLYNPYTNSYKATTYNIFVRPHQHEFKPGEMMLLNSPSMFGNVALKGQPLFLDSRFFDDLDHYKKIMGFDKPMDFKLGKEEG